MGSRMEVYLAPEHAQTVIDIAKAHGIDAQIVGRVEASDSRQLTLVTPHGTFEY
jgi:phosphoribosylformylglycinamidine cyclo-ligase